MHLLMIPVYHSCLLAALILLIHQVIQLEFVDSILSTSLDFFAIHQTVMHVLELSRESVLKRANDLSRLYFSSLINFLHLDHHRLLCLDIWRVVEDGDTLVLAIHREMSVKLRHAIDTGLIGNVEWILGAGSVAEFEDGRVERFVDCYGCDFLREPESFSHQGDVVAS
jgi:hypothetical protein